MPSHNMRQVHWNGKAADNINVLELLKCHPEDKDFPMMMPDDDLPMTRWWWPGDDINGSSQ